MPFDVDETAPSREMFKKPAILVIDDDPYQRSSISHILREHHNVISASTGAAALSMLGVVPFEAVLLDMVMPGMSGLDVLRALRQKVADLPVILMDTHVDNPAFIEALAFPQTDYLLKPLNPRLTLARLKSAVESRKQQQTQDKELLKLRRAQEDYRRLMRMATHDLKHPLANLRMAEIILRRYVEPEAVIILDGFAASLDAMQEVIDDFLGALLLNITPTLTIERVLLDDVVFDNILQFSPSAHKKNISLKQLRRPLAVTADRKRLTQAVGNLLSNAIKYSPTGATVRMYAEEQPDNKVRFCVADQGVGVAEEERDRLFTEFGKLSSRPTGQESSTGLGLWIVKNLVESMNGTVGADFPAAGGSVFWLELPAYVSAGAGT
ncbi:MAG: hypothetical protein OHK0046_09400 [Anaerolineae bacterium]